MNRFLFVVRSTANKNIELSRGVNRAETYGDCNVRSEATGEKLLYDSQDGESVMASVRASRWYFPKTECLIPIGLLTHTCC